MSRVHTRLAFSHLPTAGSYRAIHTWINTYFPRIGRCEWCAARGRWTEYATARPGRYTRNRADWIELCRTCHRHFDGFSAERREKLSVAGSRQKGMRRSPEGRANIAAANRARARPV